MKNFSATPVLGLLVWMTFFQQSFGQSAFAGVGSSGGGKAVVCRNAAGVITSSQTLDLFEGAALYGLNIPVNPRPMSEQVNAMKAKLLTTMDQSDFHLDPIIDRVQKIIHVLPDGVKINPVDDAASVVTPVNCKIEQLALYVDNSTLLVDGEIWKTLDEMNKASLVLHEAVYNLERTDDAAKDSRRSRKIVAHLFSDFQFIQVTRDIPEDAVICDAMSGEGVNQKMDYEFSLTPTSNGMSKLQFIRYANQWVFDQKISIIPMKAPWNAHDPYADGSVTDACGTDPNVECNVSGGSVFANFEGDGDIAIGYERKTVNGAVVSDFFINDGSKHVVSCGP